MSSRKWSTSSRRCSTGSVGRWVRSRSKRCDQRALRAAPDLRRDVGAEHGAGADRCTQHGVELAVGGPAGGVGRRDARHHAGVDAEELEDPVEGVLLVVDQLLVAQHVHLLAREDAEQVLELLAVAAELEVAPERREAVVGTPAFQAAGGEEVSFGLEAVGAQMGPVRVGAVDRVTDDRDQLGVRDSIADAQVRGGVPEVERGALAAQRAGRRSIEELLVALALPDPFLPAVRIARPAMIAPARPVSAGQEVLRFLGRGQEQLRVAHERLVHRGRPGFRGTDHEEVGE